MVRKSHFWLQTGLLVPSLLASTYGMKLITNNLRLFSLSPQFSPRFLCTSCGKPDHSYRGSCCSCVVTGAPLAYQPSPGTMTLFSQRCASAGLDCPGAHDHRRGNRQALRVRRLSDRWDGNRRRRAGPFDSRARSRGFSSRSNAANALRELGLESSVMAASMVARNLARTAGGLRLLSRNLARPSRGSTGTVASNSLSRGNPGRRATYRRRGELSPNY